MYLNNPLKVFLTRQPKIVSTEDSLFQKVSRVPVIDTCTSLLMHCWSTLDRFNDGYELMVCTGS